MVAQGTEMTKEGIKSAVDEAREFLKRATAVLKEAESNDYCLFGDKLTGSLRRQSMELTRSLAEMRKTGT